MANEESHRRWEVQCLHSPATIGRKEGTALAFMDIDDCGNESYPTSSMFFFSQSVCGHNDAAGPGGKKEGKTLLPISLVPYLQCKVLSGASEALLLCTNA